MLEIRICSVRFMVLYRQLELVHQSPASYFAFYVHLNVTSNGLRGISDARPYVTPVTYWLLSIVRIIRIAQVLGNLPNHPVF